MIRLSIIIPFYNVEKYIGECLESIYNQDIIESEYEVICVNDCSPDRSREIVLDFQKTHENLILIEHETNKKQGAARNNGLRAARGKYIWFVDSDDFIEKNCLKKLLETAEKDNLEILQFNMKRINNEKGTWNHKSISTETEIISGIDFINKYQVNHFTVETCNRIILRSFLIIHKLLYNEGVYSEDVTHTFKVLMSCQRFKFIPDYCFFYRVNDSSTVGHMSTSGLITADMIDSNIEILKIIHKYNIQEKCPSAVTNRVNILADFIYMKFWQLSRQERKKYFQRLKNRNIKNIKKYFSLRVYCFYNFPNFINRFDFLFKHRKVRILFNKFFLIIKQY